MEIGAEQEIIILDKKETAFTLLLKCIELSLSSFKEIYPKILENSYKTLKQDLKKGSLYLKKHTPPNNGFLSFQESYSTLDSLVRGLNMGLFKNDFAEAKIKVNSMSFTVLDIDKNEKLYTGRHQIGEIVKITEKAIYVSCFDSVIKIRKVRYQANDCSVCQMIMKANLKIGDKIK